MSKLSEIIVFGENHHNTLGLIRSLGEVGLLSNLILVNSNRLYPFVAKSRYVKRAWVVDNVYQGLNIILSQFTNSKYDYIVYPTYDTEVKILCENVCQLKDRFIVPTIINRSWSLKDCLNKEFMRILAQNVGMHTPLSWVVNYKDQLPLNITYPCLVKAIDSTSAPKSYDIIKSKEELLKVLDELYKYCDTVQIQEFIRKKTEIILLGWSDGKDEIVIPCLMNKIREYPKGFGTTGLGKVTKNIEQYIQIEKVNNYIKYLGYNGLFSVEFLISENDQAYFLEVNLRNDGNGYLPTYGGVNLPYQWYLAITGQYSKLCALPKYIHKDFVMMREFTDIMFPLKYGYPLVKWLKDYLNTDCYLYWNRKDLRPYFYFIIQKIVRFIRKR